MRSFEVHLSSSLATLHAGLWAIRAQRSNALSSSSRLNTDTSTRCTMNLTIVEWTIGNDAQSGVIQYKWPVERKLKVKLISQDNKLSYSQFCLKFRCHGNKGRSEVNLNDAVELAVPENHTLEPKITNLSCIQPKLWSFTSRKVGRSLVVGRRSVLIIH